MINQDTLDGLPDIFGVTPVTRDFIYNMVDRGFVMGGSRYMAEKFPDEIKISENTDYDFNCPYTTSYRNTLRKLGFTRRDIDKEYRDENCEAVYYHDTYDIQVVARINMDSYIKAMNSITPSFYKKYIWKSSDNYCVTRNDTREIMDQLFTLAER